MTTKVLEGQSLFDLAIQVAGSVDTAFDIAKKNNISITDNIMEINLTDIEVANRNVVSYFSNRNLFPATSNKQELEIDRIFGIELPEEFS